MPFVIVARYDSRGQSDYFSIEKVHSSLVDSIISLIRLGNHFEPVSSKKILKIGAISIIF